MIEVGIFLAVLVVGLVGFKALDNWHKRKAWRDADAFARRIMRRPPHDAR